MPAFWKEKSRSSVLLTLTVGTSHSYCGHGCQFGVAPRRQEEKEVTEDDMVGWHHWLNGHESEQTLEDSEGQGSLACCSLWGHKELDMTSWLNNNKAKTTLFFVISIGKKNLIFTPCMAFTMHQTPFLHYPIHLLSLLASAEGWFFWGSDYNHECLQSYLASQVF